MFFHCTPGYGQFDPWTDDFSFKHPLDKTRLGNFCHPWGGGGGGCTGIKWNSPMQHMERWTMTIYKPGLQRFCRPVVQCNRQMGVDSCNFVNG